MGQHAGEMRTLLREVSVKFEVELPRRTVKANSNAKIRRQAVRVSLRRERNKEYRDERSASLAFSELASMEPSSADPVC